MGFILARQIWHPCQTLLQPICFKHTLEVKYCTDSSQALQKQNVSQPTYFFLYVLGDSVMNNMLRQHLKHCNDAQSAQNKN